MARRSRPLVQIGRRYQSVSRTPGKHFRPGLIERDWHLEDRTLLTSPPSISSLLPTHGPTGGGISVTITGANFSATASQDLVTFGSQPATVVSAGSTQLTVTEPAGAGLGVPVVVTVGGQASNSVSFNYDAPQASGISPQRGYLAGGYPLTISGSNFSTVMTQDQVTIDGASATVDSATTTQIVVTAPAGTNPTAPVVVTVDGQTANPLSFAYLDYTPAGSFSADGLGPGTPAPLGSFVPLPGSTSATPADPGYYVNVVGSAVEFAAPIGYYDPGTGNSAAIPAQPGYYVSTTASATETAAPIGSYDPGTGNSAAIPAQPGYYVSTTASPTETAAPIGSYDPGTGNSAAIPAQPGYYVSTTASATENAAPIGSYDPGTGNSAAIPAQPGSYVSTTASSTETAAPIGYYDPGSGNSAPIPAQPGYYVPTAGSAVEIISPLGYYVPTSAATQPTPADPGYYVPTLGATQETPGSPGTYVPIAAQSQPTIDPPGTTSGWAAVWYTVIPNTNGPATHLLATTTRSVQAGTLAHLTITALDQYGFPTTDYTGTDSVTISDPTATPIANVTFNGNESSVVVTSTLNTLGPQSFFVADIANSVISSTAYTTVTGVTTHFVIGVSPTIYAGYPASFTVTAEDAQNNITYDYQGTVSLTDTDSTAIFPSTATFDGSTGVVTIDCALTANQIGPERITATSTTDPGVTGSAGTYVEPLPTILFAFVQCGTLYVLGDANTDVVTLRIDPTDTTKYDVLSGGANLSASPFDRSSFDAVVVLGGAGDFTLKIDTTNGSPVPSGGINFTGGSGQNTLVGPNRNNTWSITGRDSGTLDDPITFTHVQNLTGGNVGDLFNVSGTGALDGVISGGTGSTIVTGNEGALNLTYNVTTAGGSLDIMGASVTIGPNVTISTTQTDPSNGVTTGNSGNLAIYAPAYPVSLDPTSGFLLGAAGDSNAVTPDQVPTQNLVPNPATSGIIPTISLGSNDQVRADVSGGSAFSAGSVTLQVQNDTRAFGPAATVNPLSLSNNTATIAITTGDQILGAAISITTDVEDIDLTTNLPSTDAGMVTDSILGLLKQIPSLAVSQLTGISGQVVRRQATSTISVDGATIHGSDTVTIGSTAGTNASFQVVSLNGLAANGKYAIAIGYGESDATATTTITGTSSIVAANAVSITSTANTNAYVKARTAANLLSAPNVNNPSNVALALAVANTNETSHVTVDQNVSIRSANQGVAINASGGPTNEAWASPTINDNGTAAAALAFGFDSANFKTIVNGAIDANGNSGATFTADPTVTSPSIAHVDYANNSIVLPNSHLTDGEAVMYSNGNPTGGGGNAADIGGLSSTQSGNTNNYYVQVVAPNTIKLANAPSIALGSYTPIGNAAGTALGNYGAQRTLTFQPSNVIVSAGSPLSPGEIHFSTPDEFTEGEPVTFSPGTAGTAPTGLTANYTYLVHVVNANTISLEDPRNGNAPVVVTDQGTGPQTLTYTTPLQSLGQVETINFDPSGVNTGNGQITFAAPDGLANNDVVDYLGGSTSTAPGGLQQNYDYLVNVVNPTTISLLDPQNNNAPVVLTSQGTGAQGFTYQKFVYFDPATAVNPTNNTITIPNHGLQTGSLVYYHVNPDISTTTFDAPTLTSYTNGQVAAVDSSAFTLSGDDTGQVLPGASVLLTFADGSTAQATVASASYASGTDLTTVVLSAPAITGSPVEADVSATLPQTTYTGAQLSEASAASFDLAGDQTQAVPVGSKILVLYADGTSTSLTVTTSTYSSTTSTTTVVTSQNVFNGTTVNQVDVFPKDVTNYDNAIPGLVAGDVYYVSVVDANTIRLTLSAGAASDAQPITLTPATLSGTQVYGDAQQIAPSGAANGINISTNLVASNTLNSGATLTGTKIKPDTGFWSSSALQTLSQTGLSNLEDALTPFLNSLFSKAASFASSNAKNPIGGQTAQAASYGLAGSLSVNYAYHDVETTIGPTAKLTSSADVTSSASSQEQSQTESASSASKPTDANGNPTANATVALAISLGIFTNIATSTVDSGAAIDAADALIVSSLVSYPQLINSPISAFDPSQYLQSNGLDGYSYAQDGTLGIESNLFNTLALSTANAAQVGAGGALAVNVFNNTSTATVQNNSRINQTDDSKAPAPRFRKGAQSVSVDAETRMEYVSVVGIGALSFNTNGFLSAGQDFVKLVKSAVTGLGGLGVVQDLSNPFGASGNQGGIGAGILVQVDTNTTTASIQGPNNIYAGASPFAFDPTAAGTVTGNAINFPAAPGFTTGTPVVYESDPAGAPIGGLASGRTYYAIVNPSSPTSIQLATSEANAINGVFITLDSSKASGSHDSLVSGGLTVLAQTPLFFFDLAQAGASGSSLGIAGAFAIGILSNTTLAHVDSGVVVVSMGPLVVNAIDDLTRIALTGGVLATANIGVGISLGFNDVSRDTEAYIGNGYDANGVLMAPGSDGTNISALGPIVVAAVSTGTLATVSLAGVFPKQSTEYSPDEKQFFFSKNLAVRQFLGFTPNDQQLAENLLGIGNDPNQPKVGVSLAGDVSINMFDKDNTYAFINDTGTIGTAQALALAALAATTLGSFSGAAAIAFKDPKDKANASSTGLAGSISANVLYGDAQAFLIAAPVNADSLSIDAARLGGIVSISAGGAGTDNGTAVAGSISVNVLNDSAIAYVSGSNLVLAEDSNITATDSSNIWAFAGALAYSSGGSGGKGFGLAIAINMLGVQAQPALGLAEAPDLTNAYVTNSTITMGQGTFTVDSSNQNSNTTVPRIIALTASVGISSDQKGFSGAGMVSVNVLDTEAQSYLEATTIHEPANDTQPLSVEVQSTDTSGITAVGGAVAVSKGSGFGAAIGYNEIDSQTRAYIDGGSLNILGGLSVTATSSATNAGVAIGGAFSGGDGTVVAGSGSANVIKNTVDAHVANANGTVPYDLIVGGPVVVSATDTSIMVGIAGAVSVSLDGNAGGASVVYDLIQNTITAYIDNSTLTTQGTLDVSADSSPTLVGIGVGVAGSEKISIGGSVAVNSIANAVDAHVSGDSNVHAHGSINLSASQSASMVSVTGGIGVSVQSVAVGAAISYNYIGAPYDPANPVAYDKSGLATNTITAYIDASTVTTDASLSINGGLDAPAPPAASNGVTSTHVLTFYPATAVSGNVITFSTPHELYNGQPIIYQSGNANAVALGYVATSGGSTSVTPMKAGDTFYAIVESPTTIELSASPPTLPNPNPTPLQLSTTGTTDTTPSFLAPELNLLTQPANTFNPATDVSGGAITFASAPGLSTGDAVVYQEGSSTETPIGYTYNGATVPLRAGGTYYVIAVSGTEYKLAATYNDALAGNALALTNAAATGTADTIAQTFLIAVPAALNSQIISVSVAGAIATSQGSAGAIAGSVSLNLIRDNVDVAIEDLSATRTVSAAADLTMNANDTSKIIAIGGGVGITLGGVGIGASVAFNDIKNSIVSRIGGTWVAGTSSTPETISATGGNAGTITADTIGVNATESATIIDVAIAGAGAGGFALGGSIAVNRIDNVVDAHAAASTNVTGTSSVGFNATDTPSITVIAGGFAGAGTIAVGAAVAYNQVADAVLAFADTATVTSTGSIDFAAVLTADLFSLTLGIAGSGTAAVAANAAGNVLGSLVEAYLAHSNISADDNVTVTAGSNNTINGGGGSLGAAGGVGVGGSILVNKIADVTHAYINNSIVHAGGSGPTTGVDQWTQFDANGNVEATDTRTTQQINGLAVIASSTEAVTLGAASAGIAGTVGIGLNVLVNLIGDTTLAYIDQSHVNDAVNVGQSVIVRAHQATTVNNGSGAAGLGGSAGGAAGINVDVLTNKTQAYVVDSNAATAGDPSQRTSIFAGPGGVEVSATSRERILEVAASLGAGLAAGIAGAASGVSLGSSTNAYIDDANVNSAGSVAVTANNAATIKFYDGALDAGGFVGLGGSVSVGIDSETTSAFVASAGITAADGATVRADSAETINTLVGTAGAGGIAAIEGAVAVISLTPLTQAFIDNQGLSNLPSRVTTTNGAVLVHAHDTPSISDGVGSAAIGGIGVGASVDVITLAATVGAYIGAGSMVTAGTGVTVEALSSPYVSSTVVAFAGGGLTAEGAVSVFNMGIDGAASLVDSNNNSTTAQVQSSIGNSFSPNNTSGDFNSTSSTDPNVTNEQPTDIATSLNSSSSGDLVAVSLAGNAQVHGSTLAYIDTGATVTAENGGVSVTASDTPAATNTYSGVTGGVAIGVVGSVGASVTEATFHNETNAYIAASAVVSATGDVTVRAIYTNGALVHAYGGEGGIIFAGGGENATFTDASTQSAHIDGNVTKASTVTIDAEGSQSLQGQAKGAQAGTIAIGAAVGVGKIEGGTSAYLAPGGKIGESSGTAVGALAITANSSSLASLDVLATSVGFAGGENGTPTTTVDPAVNAYIGAGDAVNVSGNVSVQAAAPLAEADGTATAVSVGFAVSVAAANVTVTSSPTVTSSIDKNANVNAGGDVLVHSETDTGPGQAAPSDQFTPSTAVSPSASTVLFPLPLSNGTSVVYDPQGNPLVGGLQPFSTAVTGVTFAPSNSGDTISRTDGVSWSTAGFRAGQLIEVTGATNLADDQAFEIQRINGATMTLTAKNQLVSETDATPDTFQIVRSYSVLNPSVTLANLSFSAAASGNTVVRSDGGSWTTDGFVAGAQVTISGDTGDTGVYTIQSVSADGTTLTLAASTPLPKTQTATGQVTLTEAGALRFGASFDGTSNIDLATNTITFSTPTSFETGDVVMYDAGGSAAVGGLSPNTPYYVTKVGPDSIRLSALATPPAPITFNPAAVSATNHTITLAGFTNGEVVTYQSPPPVTFNSASVDVQIDASGNLVRDSNGNVVGDATAYNIYLPGNAFSEGEAVVYNPSGTDPVIGGLTAGAKYSVHLAGTNQIQLRDSSGNTLHITPSTDLQDTQTLTATGALPIGGLVSGNAYVVHVVSGDTFQLFDPTTNLLVPIDGTGLDGSAMHSLTQDDVVLVPSSGPQSLYVSLTSTPSGTDRLLGPGGVSLLLSTPVIGSGSSTATATGAGAGFINADVPSASLTIAPVIEAYSAASTLQGGNVTITASTLNNGKVYAFSGGGGGIDVCEAHSTLVQNPTTSASLGVPGSAATGVTLTAGLDFTLGATSNLTSTVTSVANAGAGFGGAIADSSDQVGYATTATLGAGAVADVTGNVRATTDTKTNASTNSHSEIVGLGVGADANYNGNNDPGVPLGVNVGTPAGLSALSQVEIGKGASLSGQTVALAATNSAMNLSATDHAQAIDPILIGVTTAYSTANVAGTPTTQVLIDGDPKTKVAGTQGVDVLSNQALPSVTRSTYALAVSIIPPQWASTSGTVSMQSGVTAGADATVTAGVRAAGGPLQNNVVDSTNQPLTNLALNVQSNNNGTTPQLANQGAVATGSITWDANVVINSGAQNATLTIDPNGMITQDNNVTATDANHNVLAVGDTVPASSVVNVNTAAQQATAYFFGQSSVTNSANPLFTFNNTLQGVQITNSSDRPLNIENIDVAPIDPVSEVRLDGPNLATSNNTVPFNFNIAHGTGAAIVDIENINPTQTPSDITLSGLINNPVGQTIIKNLRGNIVSTSTQQSITTNSLDIEATGDIMPTANDKLYVQLIESVDPTTNATRAPFLTAAAGGTLLMETIARRRDTNTSTLTVEVGTISAGTSLTLLLDGSVLDGAPDGTKGGLLVSRPQQTLSGHYYSHFYLPDTSSSLDYGMFADTANATPVPSLYDFRARDLNGTLTTGAGLTAAGDVNLTATAPTTANNRIDLLGTLDLNPTGSSATNTINATTYGDINLSETSGAMRVGTIQSNGGNVTLATLANDPTGDNLLLGPNAAVYAPSGTVTANVADNVTMAPGSTISTDWTAATKGQSNSNQGTVTINGDQGRADRTKPGSTINVSGQIWTPTESINGDHNDTIGLTNVTTGTNATVTTTHGASTINVGGISPFNGGVLANIQGPLTVNGDTQDTLNLDDTGDATARSAFLTNAKLTGLGMAATGVAYTGLSALNLKLGTAKDVVNTLSTASGTTSTITAQVGGNTWNVGSNAPIQGNGFVDGVAGPLVLNGGGDVMNVDDVGTPNAKKAVLTDSTLTGLGAGPISYFGMNSLTINLGSHGNTLTANVTNNLPATTNIDGGSSATDSFSGTFAHDFNGALNLTSFEKSSMQVAGDFNGALSDLSPGTVQLISVGGTMPLGGLIKAASIDNLDIGLPVATYHAGHDLAGSVTLTGELSNLSVVGNLESSIQEYGNITSAYIGGTIPAGVTLTATKTANTFGNIESLIVGPTLNTQAAGHDLAGTVNLDGHLAVLSVGGDLLSTITEHGTVQSAYVGGSVPQSVSINAQNAAAAPAGSDEPGDVHALTIGQDLAGTVNVAGTLGTLNVGNAPLTPSVTGSITPTAAVNVGGNLNSMTVGPNALAVGQNMAGTINVTGTLGSAQVAGGSPGLYTIGHAGIIDAFGGFGPVVLRVIENGVERHVELAAPAQPYVQPNAYELAGSNYVNVKYVYDSGANANPQLTAQIANGTGSTTPDQYDLSLVVYNDAAKFNLDRLDSVGASYLRNVAIEGNIVQNIGATASAFFPGDTSPTGVYLPGDALGDVATRDYTPKGAIDAQSIQAVGFGSYTNSVGVVAVGSRATTADARNLLTAGTTIVQSGSTNGTNSETFRVPFADLTIQQVVAFFLSTAAGGGQFDPNTLLFTVEGVGNGLTVTQSNAARGAAIALIGVSRTPGTASVVQTVDFRGDGASMSSEQYIAGGITSTGPLGDLTTLSKVGLNSVTVPSAFGNISAYGPIQGTIQTTGQRTDPITGVVTTIPANLGRAFVVPASRRTGAYVAVTTLWGTGINTIRGRIISRGDLISSVRGDGGSTGLIAAQGNIGVISNLIAGKPARLGGITINGPFSGQILADGNILGNLYFHGGLTGGRVVAEGNAALAPSAAQVGIVGNVVIDYGLYKTSGLDANSAILSEGEIGDATLGTKISNAGANLGFIAAQGALNTGGTPLSGLTFSNLNASDPSAAAIDAIFTDKGQPLSFDVAPDDLAGLALILSDLDAIVVGPDGKLTGTKP